MSRAMLEQAMEAMEAVRQPFYMLPPFGLDREYEQQLHAVINHNARLLETLCREVERLKAGQ